MSKLQINNCKQTDIAEGMFGIFFEDINYGADGGLYAELIENRNFEFKEAAGWKDHYSWKYDGLYGWEPEPQFGNVQLEIAAKDPRNEINPHYLKVTANRAGAGFWNRSYGGIDTTVDCNLHLFVRNPGGCAGQVTASLEDADGCAGAETFELTSDCGWTALNAVLKLSRPVAGGRLVLRLEQPGTLEFDMISLMPSDAVLGIFRKDLTALLKELKPGFLRFPGGCIVEGNTWENRYQWKESVGAIEERRVNWNRWAVHNTKEEAAYKTAFSHYNQTLGLGFYEYFLLSEYLGAKALPVMNVGLVCQYQSTELVEIGSAEFEEMVQDVLDLIEFANGDAESRWGALRCRMGHPAPFGLDRIGIGNEQWETAEVNYFERYSVFENRIHQVYPDMKLISSAGPTVNSPAYDGAWKWINQACKNNEQYTYAIDEHYYMPPKWFFENTGFYDSYSRDVRVFAGEYAAHPEGIGDLTKCNRLDAALSEAAFMTGLERNADVVVMACYAPLFARIGYTQWSPDLIWFDSKSAYGTPSYYVQKFFGHFTGDEVLSYQTAEDAEGLYYAVSRKNAEQMLYIKVVNASEQEKPLTITFDETFTLGASAVYHRVAGACKEAVNSLTEQSVAESNGTLEVTADGVKLVLPPLSFTVLCLPVI